MRAMRKGWIKLEKAPEKPRVYLLWGDDLRAVEKTANGLSYIAAPKPKLPGDKRKGEGGEGKRGSGKVGGGGKGLFTESCFDFWMARGALAQTVRLLPFICFVLFTISIFFK